MAEFRYLYLFIREDSFLKIGRHYLMRFLYGHDGYEIIAVDLPSNHGGILFLVFTRI